MTLPTAGLISFIFMIFILVLLLLLVFFCYKKDRRDKMCRLFNYYRREYTHPGGSVSSRSSGRHSHHAASPPGSFTGYAYSPPSTVSSGGGGSVVSDFSGDQELLLQSGSNREDKRSGLLPPTGHRTKQRPNLDWEMLLAQNGSRGKTQNDTLGKTGQTASRNVHAENSRKAQTDTQLEIQNETAFQGRNGNNEKSQTDSLRRSQNNSDRKSKSNTGGSRSQSDSQWRPQNNTQRSSRYDSLRKNQSSNQSGHLVTTQAEVTATTSAYMPPERLPPPPSKDKRGNAATAHRSRPGTEYPHQNPSNPDRASFRRSRSYSQGDMARLKRKQQQQDADNGRLCHQARSGSCSSLNAKKLKGILKSASTYGRKEGDSLPQQKSVRISDNNTERKISS